MRGYVTTHAFLQFSDITTLTSHHKNYCGRPLRGPSQMVSQQSQRSGHFKPKHYLQVTSVKSAQTSGSPVAAENNPVLMFLFEIFAMLRCALRVSSATGFVVAQALNRNAAYPDVGTSPIVSDQSSYLFQTTLEQWFVRWVNRQRGKISRTTAVVLRMRWVRREKEETEIHMQERKRCFTQKTRKPEKTAKLSQMVFEDWKLFCDPSLLAALLRRWSVVCFWLTTTG